MKLAFFIPIFLPEILHAKDAKVSNNTKSDAPRKFAYVAADPVQAGVQVVLAVVPDDDPSSDDLWVHAGIAELDPENLSRFGPAESDQILRGFAVAVETFKPLLQNPADVLLKLRYIAAGGSDHNDSADVPNAEWTILDRLPLWFPSGGKKMSEKERLADYEKAGGTKAASADWLRKRTERLRKKRVKD